MTACTQPGCTGTNVENYCEVCGSPAGAVPFVPAAAPAVAPAPADKPGLTDVHRGQGFDEEIPTQRIHRVKKELPVGVQDYRRRVEEAQLPDDVRKAALSEVGKLERTSDQSPEAGDIRSWLDTILDLPWGSKTTEWIDIQGSREVEATLQRLIEPAAANSGGVESGKVEPGVGASEQADTRKVEPGVADTEEADTAKVGTATATEEADSKPAGQRHDGTVETPAVLAAPIGVPHVRSQLPEQQVVGPPLVQTPAKKRRRFGSLALAAIALVALLVGALFFAASRDGRVTAQSIPTATATGSVSTPTSQPSDESTGTGSKESPIQVKDLSDPASPFQPVRIQGTYRGGGGTFLHVQREEGGEWVAFPLPTKVDERGQFTAHVELGQPGQYRLRVLDPGSGVTSKAFVLVIEG